MQEKSLIWQQPLSVYPDTPSCVPSSSGWRAMLPFVGWGHHGA